MSDLPPGVSVNDIPGNRPEELEEEAFFETLDKQFVERYGEKGKKWLIWQEHLEPDDLIWEYVTVARVLAYDQGYADGRSDEAAFQLEREQQEGEDLDWYDNERRNAEEARSTSEE